MHIMILLVGNGKADVHIEPFARCKVVHEAGGGTPVVTEDLKQLAPRLGNGL